MHSKKINFLSQPRGLYYLFLTDLWERFSYYGITAILILYMDKTFQLSTQEVYAIYGTYGALIYLVPLLGGWLADNLWGSYRTVIVGTCLIALGHFIVALRDPNYYFFYAGLAVIILGTGLFTPNIHATVGHLYKDNDPRRESGFTLAYMGRNVGTIIAPILCAWIAGRTDWHWAFIVAGLGMLVGLWTFMRGKPHYSASSFVKRTPLQNNNKKIFIFLLFPLSLSIIYLTMRHTNWTSVLLFISVLIIILRLILLAWQEDAKSRKAISTASMLTIFYMVFMILLQQSGGTLNLFTDRHINKQLGSYTLETGMFQAVEPLALVLLTPLFTCLWQYADRRKWVISDENKFTIGLFVMSSSFVVLMVSLSYQNVQGFIAMSWIYIVYVMQAMGELFIGPIGLAMISRIIPRRMLGFFMGVWVLGASLANYTAAKIGGWIIPTDEDPTMLFLHYRHAFFYLALFGFIASFILFAIHYLSRHKHRQNRPTHYLKLQYNSKLDDKTTVQ